MQTQYIQHGWSVLCHGSAIDRDTNIVSLFNVVEEVTIELQKDQTIPEQGLTIPMPLELVSLWHKRAVGKHVIADVEIALHAPDGTRLQHIVYKLDIAEQHSRMRFRMKMNGVTVKNAGEYMFRASVRGPNETQFTEVATIPFGVNVKEKE